MDLVLRNCRIAGRADGNALFDIGVDGSRIAAIQPKIAANGGEIDVGGRLVSPGFVETHIHLDKSCILDRCTSETGDLEEAIREVAKQKKFTAMVVVDALSPDAAVAAVAPALYGFKRGRMTFMRQPARLLRP